jgi:hypothetical protein
MHQRAAPSGLAERDPVIRWECRCKEPPVLLGTYDSSGRVNIKVRDRYWRIIGQVWTICPRCGSEHELDPTAAARTTLDHREEAARS